MKQRVRHSFLALLLLVPLHTVPRYTQAAEIQQVIALSFGTIDLSPSGDSVVIAAENGPAMPVAQRSVVTGGNSGSISLRSTTFEHVDVVYPSSTALSGGGSTLLITEIADHSQYTDTGVDLPGDNISVKISVGGKLTLTGNEQSRPYSGSMVIALHFN